MTYEGHLAVRVEDALEELPAEGRREVMDTIAAALAQPARWQEHGGWDGAVVHGPRSWVIFTSYVGGIVVHAIGWLS